MHFFLEKSTFVLYQVTFITGKKNPELEARSFWLTL